MGFGKRAFQHINKQQEYPNFSKVLIGRFFLALRGLWSVIKSSMGKIDYISFMLQQPTCI
jgi:hypothetical protein